MQQEEEFRTAYMSKIRDGNQITVWGELIKLETTEYGMRGILSDCYINFKEGMIPCNDIMVYTSNDQFHIGQIQKITGKINMFSKARNEGNFDSLVYYQSLKIDFAIEEEDSQCLKEDSEFGKGILRSFRQRMSVVYELCMSGKASGFYQGMVLGDKTKLDAGLKDLFFAGGISHILAISGLHVSVLGRGFYRMLRRCGVGYAVAGTAGSILLILYCIMVGGSASTVRAVGMLLLYFGAQWLGRSYDMLNALGGMVLVLLWDNPFLIENSGFWFSVMAMTGVGVVGLELSQVSVEEKSSRKRREIAQSGLWMSLGITLTTLPVTALSYYEVPMYSVLVNLVVLPLLPLAFVSAITGGLLGVWGLTPQIVSVLFLPCEWLLSLFEAICSVVSRFPGAIWICGKPKNWQVGFYYAVLFGGVYLHWFLRNYVHSNTWEKGRSFLGLKLGVWGGTIFLCMVCIFFPKEKPFEITFLDVGQGDGVYISDGDGTAYFLDGGSSSVNQVGTYRILPFLKAKGVAAIDYWFVSHCDTDHVSGLLEIIENGYKIEHIVLHERSSYSDKEKELIFQAREKGISVLFMKAGHQIRSQNMKIICLAVASEKDGISETDENENSLVLEVEWKSKKQSKTFRALFAGDISIETENTLCESGKLKDMDLVKANHHGSNYSNGTLWLDTITPTYIVVSCSENNLYGHPGRKAIERMEESGAMIFYTMENGQITFPLIQ